MTDCVLFSKEDYDSIMSHLKSARIECQSATKYSLSGKVSLYHVGEIDRQLEAVEALLKKDGQKVQVGGWFHCWEYYTQTVGESPLRGGPAAGQISFVLGIVELEDGRVVSAYPSEIQFTDQG